MQKGSFCALIFGIILSLNASSTAPRTPPARLKSVRVLPTNNQNPYSGYALPPGYNNQGVNYAAPNTGASTNGYPYQQQPGVPQTPYYREQTHASGGGVYPYGPSGTNTANTFSQGGNSRQSANPMGAGMAAVQTTAKPSHHHTTEEKHSGKGLYMFMFLTIPCIIGGCCIARMFFTPKQGLYYPEPLMFAPEPYPAGHFDHAGHGRSHSEQAWQPPRKPSERVTRSAQDLYNVPEYRETPGQPIYDYGGTPQRQQDPARRKTDPLTFMK